jgi:hypothetical protein
MFGLLVADSLFVAGTAVLIVMLGAVLWKRQTASLAVGLVGALLYLVNFAVPNARLVGLVDAGEGLFLLALLWSLSESKLWVLPVIAVLGALTKETFVPFSIVLTTAWWFSTRRDRDHASHHVLPAAAWILISWLLSLATMTGLQWSVTGTLVNPLQFGLALHHGGGYLFAASLRDRSLWYVFLWLLPTALPNLKRLPKSWLVPVGATCAMAFVLDAYFAGVPGAMGRALFSIAGPVLSLSSAMFLLRILGERLDVSDSPTWGRRTAFCSILPPVPAPGVCSTAAQECWIAELRTRPAPSLPRPVPPLVRVHGRSGARACVFFFLAVPPSISAVHEFW